MTKADLRKQFKEKRGLLSEEELETRSKQISELFFKHVDLKSVQYLHVFLPIVRLKEINTWLIINKVQDTFPTIRIVFPKIHPSDFSMDSFLYDETLVLQENAWGISEPVEGTRIQPQQIDIILLPLLAFDTAGFRVGYGKGYYDRFLLTCRTNIIKIGLSIEEPVPNIEDYNAFDVPMDSCVTPQKVWHFGRNHS